MRDASTSSKVVWQDLRYVLAAADNLGMTLVGFSMVLTTSPNAMVMAYLRERFPTSVRASGYVGTHCRPARDNGRLCGIPLAD